jgi:ATP-dependent RNA helicase DeaD
MEGNLEHWKGSMYTTLFDNLKLSPELLRAVAEMGFEKPTRIQASAIPLMMSRKDVVAQSETGSGKTAAFAIPLVERVSAKSRATQGIVLCPTRELAIQVAAECTRLLRHKKGIVALPVYGGQPIEHQLFMLQRGVQIVIGTPGRVLDHLERGSLSLDAVQIAVLDEADEMLDMGFRDDIKKILDVLSHSRQMAFFSATLPDDIRDMIKMYMNNPHTIKTESKVKTVATTSQFYCEVEPRLKAEVLCRLIDIHNIQRGIIFCNQKWIVDELVLQLKAHGYAVDGLHGDLRQPIRDRVMNAFRAGTIKLLVATDVAARGIDVENIDAVVNYDLPQDEEDYVHRIGRTGRAGKVGVAFTLVTGRGFYKLRSIEQFAGVRIQRMPTPSCEDARAQLEARMIARVREVIAQGHLSHFAAMVEKMCSDDFTAIDVAAALLKMQTPKPKEQINVQSHADRDRRKNQKRPERENRLFHKKKFFDHKNQKGGRRSQGKNRF